MSALDQWWNRLELRQAGEDPDRPHTWRLDGLWRAACAELHEREQRALEARTKPPPAPPTPPVFRLFPPSIP